MLLATVAIVSIAATGSVAAQDTINVSDDGNPATGAAPNCDRTTEFTDIQDAVDNANDGDTIVVCPGKYNESVRVDKSVRIVAENPETTQNTDRSVLSNEFGQIIGQANQTAFSVEATGVSIEGFSITAYDGAAVATSDIVDWSS